MSKLCSFTVQAQRCCPTIIAIAHSLFYHEHEMQCRDHHMNELRLAMRDLNAAFEAVDAMYPNSLETPAVATEGEYSASLPPHMRPAVVTHGADDEIPF